MQTECYKETFFVKIVSILKNNTIFASVLSQKNMTDVKENIINVTVDLMCKVGIKSITVDDIAQQLGISKKTFYQHFANKEELVELVLTILEQKQSERINKYFPAGTPAQKIEDTIIKALELYQRQRNRDRER